MIMWTIDLVVAYCMQNNITRVAIVIMNLKCASNRALEHTCSLLCVYREILDSVRMLYSAGARIIYFYSACSINSVLNLHSFDILFIEGIMLPMV